MQRGHNMSIAETAQLTRSHTFPPVRPASNDPQGALPRTDGEPIALQNIGTKLPFNHNQTIFNEGDPAELAYKVLSSSVRLCNHLADGRRQIVQFLFPGYLFSFMELAGHSLTAEAINDVVLISYPQHQTIHLGVQDPSLLERFVALMSQWLHMMHDHLRLLGRQAALERVSSFLLSLKERRGAEEGDALEIPMSRQDIADYLGLTIGTVCRVLTKLRRSRAIGIPNIHELVLNDVEALFAVAEGGD
jgi:CRP/FNR family transcriptional regulator, nitrogen fixation regulation protein